MLCCVSLKGTKFDLQTTTTTIYIKWERIAKRLYDSRHLKAGKERRRAIGGAKAATESKWNSHLIFTIFLRFVVKLSKLWSENFHCFCCYCCRSFVLGVTLGWRVDSPRKADVTSFYFLILLLFRLTRGLPSGTATPTCCSPVFT